jgi:hypothetical protein
MVGGIAFNDIPARKKDTAACLLLEIFSDLAPY